MGRVDTTENAGPVSSSAVSLLCWPRSPLQSTDEGSMFPSPCISHRGVPRRGILFEFEGPSLDGCPRGAPAACWMRRCQAPARCAVRQQPPAHAKEDPNSLHLMHVVFSAACSMVSTSLACSRWEMLSQERLSLVGAVDQ